MNIPGLRPDVLERLKPYLQLAETLGNLVGQLAGGRIESLDVRLQGELATSDSQPIVVAALKRFAVTSTSRASELCQCGHRSEGSRDSHH